MAEFCVDCWNDLFGTHLSEKQVVLSAEETLCEGCQKTKYVVIITKAARRTRRLRRVLFPLWFVVAWLRFAVALPRLLYQEHKRKKNHSR